MKISVLMCTYNGEKYIEEQLESIKHQTRIPDEVIIVDDCSTDNTFEIIERYILHNKLSWELKKNNENKGWKRNFTDGFKYTTGDIIFCSDQDDVWSKDKINLMAKAFEDKNTKLVACKVKIVNEVKNEIKKWLGKFPASKETCMVSNINFNSSFYASREPGCAIAFRREILELYFKFWYEDYPHDQLLWNIAKSMDAAKEIDKILIDYRRGQTSVFETASRKKSTELRVKKIKSLSKKIEKIRNILNEIGASQSKKQICDAALKWIKFRQDFIVDLRLSRIFLLFRYIRYYNPKILILVDIFDYISLKFRKVIHVFL